MKFFRDGGAADDGAAFEDQRLQPLLREIKCGDERVVAAADDDDFTRRRHGQFFPFPVSFKISSAARRPDAPMMPPPGCVAEPHM